MGYKMGGAVSKAKRCMQGGSRLEFECLQDPLDLDLTLEGSSLAIEELVDIDIRISGGRWV